MPMVESLYKALSFKLLTRVFVRMLGEEETVNFACINGNMQQAGKSLRSGTRCEVGVEEIIVRILDFSNAN
jgi:hypothetical protein